MANLVFILLVLPTLAWICTFCAAFGNDSETNVKIVYLGSVDGKSFFSITGISMTWLEAKENCTESGMKLASISSIEQRTLITQAIVNLNFTGPHFWTSGRDAGTPRQLLWDDSRESLNETVVNRYYNSAGTLTCLSFIPLTNNSFDFDAHLCSEKYAALCEISHGK